MGVMSSAVRVAHVMKYSGEQGDSDHLALEISCLRNTLAVFKYRISPSFGDWGCEGQGGPRESGGD